ncbi:MAG: hypothetical protein ABR985_08010 [Methanotrichaceae archaeon]|jgi:hypothetical protein
MIRIYGIEPIIQNPIRLLEIYMEQRCIEQGDLHRQELVALELDIRREILDFIGFELRRMREIGEELGLTKSLETTSLFWRRLCLLSKRGIATA